MECGRDRREVRPRSDLTLLTEEGRNRVCRGGVEGEVMQQIMSLLVSASREKLL